MSKVYSEEAQLLLRSSVGKEFLTAVNNKELRKAIAIAEEFFYGNRSTALNVLDEFRKF